MTTKTPAGPLQIPVPGVANPYTGSPLFVFTPGIENYEKVRLNQEIELKLDSGVVRKGTVQGKNVAPLIDLIVANGSQSMQAAGRVYSASSLVQVLTDQVPEDVLDVTKLYTAIQVVVQPEAPTPATV